MPCVDMAALVVPQLVVGLCQGSFSNMIVHLGHLPPYLVSHLLVQQALGAIEMDSEGLLSLCYRAHIIAILIATFGLGARLDEWILLQPVE